ncbi:MAG: hypothetical protein ABL998_01245 [Planctomycetota bacterium]
MSQNDELRPDEASPKGGRKPEPLDRRQLVKRLALANFVLLYSPLASARTVETGCGGYQGGLLVPDAACTPNNRDADCGKQIIEGASSTVSSDEDCGWGANGANADNCCGGISWAPQGGTVGYFNDVTCGYLGTSRVLSRADADCGLPDPRGNRMKDNDCGAWIIGGWPPVILPPSDNFVE